MRQNTLCQRPKRASSISTMGLIEADEGTVVCQRPKRASSISTAEYQSRKLLTG